MLPFKLFLNKTNETTSDLFIDMCVKVMSFQEPDELNYTIKEFETNFRQISEAAQAGNPFAKRELENLRIQKELNDKKAELNQAYQEINTFEIENREKIVSLQVQISGIIREANILIDEIGNSELKKFEHYKKLRELTQKLDALLEDNSKIFEFTYKYKKFLDTNHELSLLALERLKGDSFYKLINHRKVRNLERFFMDCENINFSDTMTELRDLQRNFFEIQIKYKAFPIMSDSILTEIAKPRLVTF